MFKIYGIENCLFCNKTKQLLDDMNITYDYVLININIKTEFLNNMADKTNNQRTFPLIFQNDIFIGGYSDIEDYIAFL